jgi:hypothetical protein
MCSYLPCFILHLTKQFAHIYNYQPDTFTQYLVYCFLLKTHPLQFVKKYKQGKQQIRGRQL